MATVEKNINAAKVRTETARHEPVYCYTTERLAEAGQQKR